MRWFVKSKNTKFNSNKVIVFSTETRTNRQEQTMFHAVLQNLEATETKKKEKKIKQEHKTNSLSPPLT